MTENRKNWLYPEASGLYFPHDGFVMRATDGKQYDIDEECELLNELHEENQLLKEEKELLKNKLDRIEDILPHYLSCAEIREFKSKTFKENMALMKCWNKRYQK